MTDAVAPVAAPALREAAHGAPRTGTLRRDATERTPSWRRWAEVAFAAHEAGVPS